MQKLFLIRRGLDTFLGPMSLQELKSSYGKMSFGFQDEISGHLGPWVSLENIEGLRKLYPEVAAIVHHDISTSWGGGDQVTKVVRSASHLSRSKKPKSRAGGFALGFFLMAAVAATAAFYLARTSKLNGKLFSDEVDSTNVAAMNALNSGDAEFSNFMNGQLKTVLPKVLRSKSAMQSWLPFLRAYAFMESGEIEGLSGNVLRGTVLSPPTSLPAECTLKYWQKKWSYNTEGLVAVSALKPLPKGHWASFLQWDPHWMRRRKVSGWIKPRNYYEACFAMAAKAFYDVYGAQQTTQIQIPQGVDPNEWRASLTSVDKRLNLMRQVLAARSNEDLDALSRSYISSSKEVARDSLAIMNCYDAANNFEVLEQCTSASKDTKDVWGNHFEFRHRLSALRFLARDAMRPEDQKVWDVVSGGEPIYLDSLTGLDFHPEWSFYKALRKNPSLSESILNQLSSQYPEVNFRDFTPGRGQ